jgi:hypothetical protein
MRYIDRVLGQNEEIVHETGLHWIALFAPVASLLIGIIAIREVNWNNVGRALP